MSKESNVRLAMLALLSQGYVVQSQPKNDDGIVTMNAVLPGGSVYKIATGDDVNDWVFNEDTILLADDVSITGCTIPKLFESTDSKLTDCTISSFNGAGSYENCTFTNPKEAGSTLGAKLVSNCINIKGEMYDAVRTDSLHIGSDGTCKVTGFIVVAGINYHSLETFDPVSTWVNLSDGEFVHDKVLSAAFDTVYRASNNMGKIKDTIADGGVIKC